MSQKVEDLIAGEIEAIVSRNAAEKNAEIDFDKILEEYLALIPNSKIGNDELVGMDQPTMIEHLTVDAYKAYNEVEARFGAEIMRKVERQIMLAVIDRLWVEHLTEMDDLREGVGLQAYGQRDPLVVYKTEGYRMYQQLLEHIQHDVVHTMFRVQPAVAEQPVQTRMSQEVTTNRDGETSNVPARSRKIGPNDKCFCGSGKKYKFCHGAPAARNKIA